ncbi:HTH-type transcriptional regulator eutR [Actinoplanes sp. SE50]|uniref:helix-turn-helix transcriptional regulator n=1 Tax=unclassified Actinoplanes TaxID=2626549 RepID=UPI00023EC92E|nr:MULTISPECIES: helix-turn-helix transcriptional regulator [unclassified Actinoplanes]AEV83152.1 HTH-type transcriptional regulator eutR [Actinoplanes sp. SE50/110]ATO81545.1 HTH-type transcriptional regulator eutR [Actinoplanes sp. SE50]SLL98953.1 AraC family transcriptional regulator [Actinoplanes sp. SE50/110]
MEQPAAQTSSIELRGTDTVEEFLNAAYGTGMRLRDTGTPPVLRHERVDAGTFAVETAHQSADLKFQIDALRKIVVTRNSSARLERGCDGTTQRYEPGALFLMSHPNRPYTVRWHPGTLDNCIIDADSLAKVAATAPGRRAEPLRFTSLEPVSKRAAASWWATRTYAAELLAGPHPTTPLMLSGIAGLLAAATLTTFANTALTDPTIEDRHDASPSTLRRAIAYLEAHPADDISTADIAAAAHVTVRAIQLAFRRHLDTTPTAYLRRVRLEHAHQDLMAADPATTTVTAIAARWGFADHSRFTALYRETFGTTPSRTLRPG